MDENMKAGREAGMGPTQETGEGGKGITGCSENADEEDRRLGVHGGCDTSKWRKGPERGLPLSII